MTTSERAATEFALAAPVAEVRRHRPGHINDGWLVVCAGTDQRYLLQRMNPAVLSDAEGVMGNIVRVSAHLRARGAADLVPTLVPTRDGASHWRDDSGATWRTYEYVERGHSRPTIERDEEAREVGWAFGRLHRLLADLDPRSLTETLPGFHDPARRLRQLEAAVADDAAGRAAGCRAEIDELLARPEVVELTDVVAGPAVPRRTVHNDAKTDNVLLDDVSGRAVCVVDLDTLMPGSVLWDVGDLVRSATATTAEDAADASQTAVDVRRFAALLAGYVDGTHGLLTAAERAGLAAAGPLVTFEQAARFLADHVAGDVYYRVSRPGHNLDRARMQLRLLASMLDQRVLLETTAATVSAAATKADG